MYCYIFDLVTINKVGGGGVVYPIDGVEVKGTHSILCYFDGDFTRMAK